MGIQRQLTRVLDGSGTCRKGKYTDVIGVYVVNFLGLNYSCIWHTEKTDWNEGYDMENVLVVVDDKIYYY